MINGLGILYLLFETILFVIHFFIENRDSISDNDRKGESFQWTIFRKNG